MLVVIFMNGKKTYLFSGDPTQKRHFINNQESFPCDSFILKANYVYI